jgi:hypothetical protein
MHLPANTFYDRVFQLHSIKLYHINFSIWLKNISYKFSIFLLDVIYKYTYNFTHILNTLPYIFIKKGPLLRGGTKQKRTDIN